MRHYKYIKLITKEIQLRTKADIFYLIAFMSILALIAFHTHKLNKMGECIASGGASNGKGECIIAHKPTGTIMKVRK